MARFTKLLVANRGEIALRVMRTARQMGLQVVAVYTDADADAPHVEFADQAVRIGAGPVGDSYLSVDKILAAATQTGADAIHPGYGFFSENAGFVAACQKAGLVFVGPPAKAVELMGNKAAAKRRMIAAGVPCVPGYEGADQSVKTLQVAADRIGYPVMIKAAAGGGGRGMRLVAKASDFASALNTARSEAMNAFGSDEVILEKAVIRPRHVEVQIFADQHGTVVHLGERDCSVQRRHQKVVEEAPCPVMTPDLRGRMGAAAVEAARANAYEGAGTVEFLLDANNDFYFLEMNTRLQVEHPVTELVTGRDLVALQLTVAQGEPLGFSQQNVTLTGHAIEARLYAEDPTAGFLPSTGELQILTLPKADGIRVDSGVRQGQTVSPYYDPMLAKIIAYGSTRDQARHRLVNALEETVLFGPASNRDFLRLVLTQQCFADGQATTAFIDEEFGEAGVSGDLEFTDIALAAALLFAALQDRAFAASASVTKALLGFGSPGFLLSQMTLAQGDLVTRLTIRQMRNGDLLIASGDMQAIVSGLGGTMRINGRKVDVKASHYDGHKIYVATAARIFALDHVKAARAQDQGSSGQITAPMHGNLLEVFVSEGDTVSPGTRLAVLEAMKMQHEILAGVAGQVQTVLAIAGSQVKAGNLLFEIKEPEA